MPLHFVADQGRDSHAAGFESITRAYGPALQYYSISVVNPSEVTTCKLLIDKRMTVVGVCCYKSKLAPSDRSPFD